MKIANPDQLPSTDASIRELLEQAHDLEQEGEFEQAIGYYNTILKKDKKNEAAYNRLFIIYRKLKDYASELASIDQAISVFDMDPKTGKKPKGNSIEKLSMSLGRLTGLMDKKGNSLYDPEPVATWKRRRLMVLKRLKSKPRAPKKTVKAAPSKNRSGKASVLRVVSKSDAPIQTKSISKLKSINSKTVKSKKR